MSAVRSAIDAHRHAIERTRALDALCGYLKSDEPVFAEADAVSKQTTDEERAAWREVRCARPENASDLAGLAVHFGQVIDEFDRDVDRDRETFEAFDALRDACLALVGRGMVP